MFLPLTYNIGLSFTHAHAASKKEPISDKTILLHDRTAHTTLTDHNEGLHKSTVEVRTCRAVIEGSG